MSTFIETSIFFGVVVSLPAYGAGMFLKQCFPVCRDYLKHRMLLCSRSTTPDISPVEEEISFISSSIP